MEDELFADVIDSLVTDGTMPAAEGNFRKAHHTMARELEEQVKRPGRTMTTLRDICQHFYKMRRKAEERAALQALHMLRSHMLMHEVIPFQADKPLGPCR